MKVSVCIPVYNGEKYIGRAIESILNQSYIDYELLIVDNKSTDHTIEKVEQFSDSRIRLLKNDKNYGMFENWNICLREARGKYIQLLCADDFLESDCLKRKVNILEKHSDAVLIFSASNVVNAQEKIIMKRRPFHKNVICDGRKMALKSFRSGNLYGEPSNVLFCRRASEKAGEFTKELCYSSDWDYWIRLSMEGRTAYIDQCLTNFRISNVSSTSKFVKQLKILRKDDAFFIQKIRMNPELSIKLWDHLIHAVAINIRLYAKAAFCLGVSIFEN